MNKKLAKRLAELLVAVEKGEIADIALDITYADGSEYFYPGEKKFMDIAIFAYKNGIASGEKPEAFHQSFK